MFFSKETKVIQHRVDLKEIGECFYTWIDLLINDAAIEFHGKYENFPLPINTKDAVKSIPNSEGVNKSGTIRNINKNLLGKNVAQGIEERLNKHFTKNNNTEAEIKTLPAEIQQALNDFLVNAAKIAMIHIRYKASDDNAGGRNLTPSEFEFIVNVLRAKNFEKFIIIGDLEKIPANFLTLIHKNPDCFCLDYIGKKSDYKVALDAWLKGAKPLAKQIQLIKLIRENFNVSLLIGRKSGAGLDTHAYAGMNTIFLEDDPFNKRYATPIKESHVVWKDFYQENSLLKGNNVSGEWKNVCLKNLQPVFFPTLNMGMVLNQSFDKKPKSSEQKKVEEMMGKVIDELDNMYVSQLEEGGNDNSTGYRVIG